MNYTAADGETYTLNLIDTLGTSTFPMRWPQPPGL